MELQIQKLKEQQSKEIDDAKAELAKQQELLEEERKRLAVERDVAAEKLREGKGEANGGVAKDAA